MHKILFSVRYDLFHKLKNDISVTVAPLDMQLAVLASVVVHSLYNWVFTYMIITILLVGKWNLKVVLIYISQLSRGDELSFFFFYKYLLSFCGFCLFVRELTLNFKLLMRQKSGLFCCFLHTCYFLPSDAEYASPATTVINSPILNIFRSVEDSTFYKMPMLLITWFISLWFIDGKQAYFSAKSSLMSP